MTASSHDSVVVFAVRDGNPKNIQTWDDLIRDDVAVITPNPFTSGGAMWNVMAAYGAQIKAGKTEEEAIAYLTALYQHITVQDKSAREALATFAAGQGDVLLSYENEAIIAQQKGEPIDYVVPEATLLIENPVAITLNGDALVPGPGIRRLPVHPRGQTIFGQKGYRPVVPEALAQFAVRRARRSCSRSRSWAAGPTSRRSSSIRSTGSWPGSSTSSASSR